jgi:hypothetical protein
MAHEGVGVPEKTAYDLRREEYIQKLYTAAAGRGEASFYWFELQQYESGK